MNAQSSHDKQLSLTSPGPGGRGGGGYSRPFYMARLLPKVQTLTLLFTVFDRKGYPFHVPTGSFFCWVYLRYFESPF